MSSNFTNISFFFERVHILEAQLKHSCAFSYADMRPLTEEESKAVFTKLANYIVRTILLV